MNVAPQPARRHGRATEVAARQGEGEHDATKAAPQPQRHEEDNEDRDIKEETKIPGVDEKDEAAKTKRKKRPKQKTCKRRSEAGEEAKEKNGRRRRPEPAQTTQPQAHKEPSKPRLPHEDEGKATTGRGTKATNANEKVPKKHRPEAATKPRRRRRRRTRTRNLRIRSPTPCPLGHGGA